MPYGQWLIAHLEEELCSDTTHSPLLLINDSIKEKHFTIDTTKPYFVKKTSTWSYPVKRHLIYQEL